MSQSTKTDEIGLSPVRSAPIVSLLRGPRAPSAAVPMPPTRYAAATDETSGKCLSHQCRSSGSNKFKQQLHVYSKALPFIKTLEDQLAREDYTLILMSTYYTLTKHDVSRMVETTDLFFLL